MVKTTGKINSRGGLAFSIRQLTQFNAVKGAFSVVTSAEASKGQITITGEEKVLFNEVYGERLRKGTKKDSPSAMTQEFKLYDKDGTIELTAHYRPRKNVSELQLYTNEKAGFKPPAGNIWFAFLKEGEDILHLGHMSKEEWGCTDTDTDAMVRDLVEDEIYQQSVHGISPPGDKVLFSSFGYRRDPAVARNVLVSRKWLCEIDTDHFTFISRVTGEPYVEAHHLIPVNAQGGFKAASLDVEANIISLCPNCHRIMHHGCYDEVEKALVCLLDSRRQSLKESGIEITEAELLELYFPSAES